MDKADKKYVELCDLGTGGKCSAKDDQIIALTSQIDSLKKELIPNWRTKQWIRKLPTNRSTTIWLQLQKSSRRMVKHIDGVLV